MKYLFFLLGLLISCTPNTEVIQIEYFENGNIKNKISRLDGDTLNLKYEEYFQDGAIRAIGKISNSGLRIDQWKYFSNTGELFAEGRYERGLKIGTWEYLDRSIEWEVYNESNGLFEFNYPKDWSSLKDDDVGIISFFDDSLSNDFITRINISKINTSKDLNLVSEESINDINEYFDRVEILDSFESLINSRSTITNIMNVNSKGAQIYSWQVLIMGSENEVYVLNMYSGQDEKQLFSEISNSMFIY